MWKLARLVVLLVILQCSCAAPAPACMGTLCGPTVNADEARIVLAAPGSLGTLSGPRAVVADAPLAPSSGTVVTAVTTVSAPIAGPVAACCATATTIDVCCSVNPCCEACPTRVTCEPPKPKEIFVAADEDSRDCSSETPKCGGYFLRELNDPSPSQKYVSGLDFLTSRLSEDDVHDAQTAPLNEVIFSGYMGKPGKDDVSLFVVTGLFRGLPGKTPNDNVEYAFFSNVEAQCNPVACQSEPCAPSCQPATPVPKVTMMQAKMLNGETGMPREFPKTNLDVTKATEGGVPEAWISQNVVSGRAIVAFTLSEISARVHQVFFRVPQQTPKCRLHRKKCAFGLVRTYRRDASRCPQMVGCMKSGRRLCAKEKPICDAGYTAFKFRVPHRIGNETVACYDFSCEPTWMLPTPPLGGSFNAFSERNMTRQVNSRIKCHELPGMRSSRRKIKRCLRGKHLAKRSLRKAFTECLASGVSVSDCRTRVRRRNLRKL